MLLPPVAFQHPLNARVRVPHVLRPDAGQLPKNAHLPGFRTFRIPCQIKRVFRQAFRQRPRASPHAQRNIGADGKRALLINRFHFSSPASLFSAFCRTGSACNFSAGRSCFPFQGSKTRRGRLSRPCRVLSHALSFTPFRVQNISCAYPTSRRAWLRYAFRPSGRPQRIRAAARPRSRKAGRAAGNSCSAGSTHI